MLVLKNNEAKCLYLKQFSVKRPDENLPNVYNLPYGNGNTDDFVLIDVPSGQIREFVTYPEFVDEYSKKMKTQCSDFPPPWVSFGRNMNDGTVCIFWDKIIQVKDGHHRVAALKKIGKSKISVYMPLSHYKELLKYM